MCDIELKYLHKYLLYMQNLNILRSNTIAKNCAIQYIYIIYNFVFNKIVSI